MSWASGSLWEAISILNAVYYDYCKVFRKYRAGDNIGFHFDMTQVWRNHSDTVKNKAAAYSEQAMKHQPKIHLSYGY